MISIGTEVHLLMHATVRQSRKPYPSYLAIDPGKIAAHDRFSAPPVFQKPP